MFGKLLNSNERQLNKLTPIVKDINRKWEEFRDLTEEDFLNKTNTWKKDLKDIDDVRKQESYLSEILPEAFALVKEATYRVDDKKTLHDERLNYTPYPGIRKEIGHPRLTPLTTTKPPLPKPSRGSATELILSGRSNKV